MAAGGTQISELFQQAVTLHRQGQLGLAETYYRQVLASRPQHAGTLSNLGSILARDDKRLDEALAMMAQAVTLEPGNAAFQLNLAFGFYRVGRLDEAEKAYLASIRLEPGNAVAYENLAKVYYDRGELDRVLQLLEEGLDKIPGNSSLYALQATCLSAAGRFDEAIGACRHVLQQEPNNAGIMRLLAKLKKHQYVDDEVRAMEALLADQSITAGDRIQLCFGLGKVYEDLQQYDRSFDYYAQGNSLKRKSISFDIREREDGFNRISAFFNGEFFRQHRYGDFSEFTPVFVMGMPRSGSTLIEQILCQHDRVSTIGEVDCMQHAVFSVLRNKPSPEFPEGLADLNVEDVSAMRRQYLQYVRNLTDKPFVVDKMPGNYIYIGLIRLMFPGARIIHTRRDPVATCWSCFLQLFATGQRFAFDLTELGKYYLIYRRLMQHWHEVLPGMIYDIDYEQLVRNQEDETGKLLDYCGLPWDENCLNFHRAGGWVSTASQQQVREKIYDSSLERWRPYEANLGPLLEALGIRKEDMRKNSGVEN